MTIKVDLHNADCFDAFDKIQGHSVDLVCIDPPYGTTNIPWDTIMDFKVMWKHIMKVCNRKANILIFGSQPFSSFVIHSNLEHFKYELIWNKNKCGSPGLSKLRPQKVHENIMVFSLDKGATYNPIFEEGDAYKREAKDKVNGYGSGRNTHGYGFGNKVFLGSENKGTRYPKSILHASRNFSAQQTVHPTQKPTNLLNWLIMTYSNPGDTVLDFVMGSGSCGVSAKMTGRNFIGIEKSEEYFDIAESRIDAVQENVVGVDDKQLTTQLHKDMMTTPNKKHEVRA